MGDYWPQTVEAIMYPGTAATDFDSVAKIDAYRKNTGSVFYRVGVGMLGGYNGWSFYVKDKGAADFKQLAAPLSCTLTMTKDNDANGGTEYAGTPFGLTFYGVWTEGLRWEKAKLGNTDVGSMERYVPSPQIKNGALCEDGATKYRLKADVIVNIPKVVTGCTAFATMQSPGTLPSTPDTNNHPELTPGTVTTATNLMCVRETEFTNSTNCKYVTGMKNTKTRL